ncbi:MAG: hypothetical protein GXX84_16060 [Acidobacteria bacterium]|nr:hypothetical protein [Acidobacteriota bacterium]
MSRRSVHAKFTSLILCFALFPVTAPYTVAETVAGSPLGTVVTQGRVTVGNAVAPTGTTIFAGDKVSSSQPALISFSGGSRVEMTKAAATFTRQGDTLVVDTNQGLLRFNFKKGEPVQINAGKFQFTGSQDSEHVGELGVNQDGELVMNLTQGTLMALNTATGARTEVTPGNPMTVFNNRAGSGAAAAAARGASAAKVALIIAGVVGAVGLGIGIHYAVKSDSSR